MANTSVVFLSHPNPSQESAEVISYAIANLFKAQTFRLISAMPQPCIDNARHLGNKFNLTGLVSELWNPREKLYAGLVSRGELSAMQGWTHEVSETSWNEEDFAFSHLRLMRALKSLRNEPTVVCMPQEVLTQCLDLLSLPTKQHQIFVVVSSPASVKRKVLLSCATIEEIRTSMIGDEAGTMDKKIVSMVKEHEEAVRKLFLRKLPAGDGFSSQGEIDEFAAKTKDILALYSSKLEQANTEVHSTAYKLRQYICDYDAALAQVTAKVRDQSTHQSELEQRLAASLSSSLTDIASIGKSLTSMEARLWQDRVALDGVQLIMPVKRKPLQIVEVTEYPGKIVAKIRSFRHYLSYAYLTISDINGEVLKSSDKEIKINEMEVVVCERKELPVGRYSLCFSNYPSRSKYVSEAVAFEVTDKGEWDYRESYFYTHCQDVEGLEKELEASAPGALQAFRQVVSYWADADASMISEFTRILRENLGVTDPQGLRDIFSAQGYSFVAS